MNDSIDYDVGHRRGTIFGLTIAEILILFLFIILLLFLVLTTHTDEAQNELNDELTTITNERNDFHNLYRSTYAENEILTEEIQKLQKILDEAGGHESVGQYVEQLKHAVQDADKQKQIVEDALDRLENEYQTLVRKGENPPCWYSTVNLANKETREKPLYIFDIGVYDEFIDVRRRESPSGSAEDDGGQPYYVEYNSFALDEVPFATRMSDLDVLKYFQPLHNLGKNSKVRTYSCVFFVSVWDKTSPEAKTRWKQAHEQVLEGLFGTYLVQDDPWPYEQI